MAAIIIYYNDVRLSKYQQGIRKQAVTDRLTGLPNRFACYEMMEASCSANCKVMST